MEMDYTQFNMGNLFDIVASPGFRTATISSGVFFPKEYIRKKKIKNLFNF